MIRSVNIVLGVITIAAGAWMFTVKHNTEALEHKIAAVNQKIQRAQQKLVVLRATWAQENDPNRLAKLSHQFLPQLKPMAPSQLVSWQQLAAALPPAGSAPPGRAAPPPALLADNAQSAPPVAAPAKADLAAAIAPPPRSRPKPKLRQVAHIVPPSAHRPIIRSARRRPIPVQRLPAETPQPDVNRAVHPMGARVMSITAESAHPQGSGSVFGGYGADLPPPQPLSSASGGAAP
ncbi:MAG TPA: hypothetical protein PK677_01375 [Acidiphilium sp.]|nr:MAG: hypothetical protein B7Z67_05805 [Acidiphilium sp. 21-60-14]OYV91500.1 MAG: hypothetical protein B7Z57_04510 [Acidiphilium sp. 37-60-79]OZB39704.1 MAG: hypothetical protein B7X48_07660 [Acidiphilium sp. 34-60-192]HQT87187.1 hypothetical protein [Acidiphilium sp.]HQU23523.1 hypothetical protein [Acidiphilium sp.]